MLIKINIIWVSKYFINIKEKRKWNKKLNAVTFRTRSNAIWACDYKNSTI